MRSLHETKPWLFVIGRYQENQLATNGYSYLYVRKRLCESHVWPNQSSTLRALTIAAAGVRREYSSVVYGSPT